MTDDELTARLGAHHAPAGLYAAHKALPFGGRLHCSVKEVEAGSWQEILIDYEVGASGIADGAWFKLTFKFYSDWALFQTTDPAAPDYVSAEYRAGPLAPGQTPATVQHLAVRFDQKGHERPYQKAVIVDVVDGYLNAGDHILIRLGDRRGGSPGTRVQTFVEDAFRMRAYVDPLGTSRFVAVPGDLQFRIAAGPPARVLLKGSRVTRPGVPLAWRASLQDRWGNVCSHTGGRARVRWRQGSGPAHEQWLDFPATGWATQPVPVPALAAGEWQLQVDAVDHPAVPTASAWLTIDEAWPAPRAWYADLHVHAHDTVGTNSPAYNAAYARDVGGIDVLGYTANDFQITDAHWQLGVEAVNTINEPGRFVAYPVQEWCGSSTAGGDHNVVFLGDAAPDFPYNAKGEHNRTLLWNEDMRTQAVELGRWPVQELWAAYVDEAETHLVMPHVGGRRYIPDWHHPELERLVEIASSWGHFGWLYQDVIARGYRLGVAASGDEHRGRPGGGPPGVQVFGVKGGLTGVLADRLDRATIGRALRARRTWATTGEPLAALLRCGAHLQGEAFVHQGPAVLEYRLLGDAGWEEVLLRDHQGVLMRRDLHAERGYGERRVRLRWGGARIRDRYRWAAWRGTLEVTGSTVLGFTGGGFEHPEESCWRAGPTSIAFRSETYGDADSIELEVADLRAARFTLRASIDGYVKVGDPRQPNPFVHAPGVEWQVSGAELLAAGELRRELGGSELFVALERLSDAPLPRELSGRFEVDPHNAPFGHRPVYLQARQRDDAKAWTSALFITFQG